MGGVSSSIWAFLRARRVPPSSVRRSVFFAIFATLNAAQAYPEIKGCDSVVSALEAKGLHPVSDCRWDSRLKVQWADSCVPGFCRMICTQYGKILETNEPQDPLNPVVMCGVCDPDILSSDCKYDKENRKFFNSKLACECDPKTAQCNSNAQGDVVGDALDMGKKVIEAIKAASGDGSFCEAEFASSTTFDLGTLVPGDGTKNFKQAKQLSIAPAVGCKGGFTKFSAQCLPVQSAGIIDAAKRGAADLCASGFFFQMPIGLDAILPSRVSSIQPARTGLVGVSPRSTVVCTKPEGCPFELEVQVKYFEVIPASLIGEPDEKQKTMNGKLRVIGKVAYNPTPLQLTGDPRFIFVKESIKKIDRSFKAYNLSGTDEVEIREVAVKNGCNQDGIQYALSTKSSDSCLVFDASQPTRVKASGRCSIDIAAQIDIEKVKASGSTPYLGCKLEVTYGKKGGDSFSTQLAMTSYVFETLGDVPPEMKDSVNQEQQNRGRDLAGDKNEKRDSDVASPCRLKRVDDAVIDFGMLLAGNQEQNDAAAKALGLEMSGKCDGFTDFEFECENHSSEMNLCDALEQVKMPLVYLPRDFYENKFGLPVKVVPIDSGYFQCRSSPCPFDVTLKISYSYADEEGDLIEGGFDGDTLEFKLRGSVEYPYSRLQIAQSTTSEVYSDAAGTIRSQWSARIEAATMASGNPISLNKVELVEAHPLEFDCKNSKAIRFSDPVSTSNTLRSSSDFTEIKVAFEVAPGLAAANYDHCAVKVSYSVGQIQETLLVPIQVSVKQDPPVGLVTQNIISMAKIKPDTTPGVEGVYNLKFSRTLNSLLPEDVSVEILSWKPRGDSPGCRYFTLDKFSSGDAYCEGEKNAIEAATLDKNRKACWRQVVFKSFAGDRPVGRQACKVDVEWKREDNDAVITVPIEITGEFLP